MRTGMYIGLQGLLWCTFAMWSVSWLDQRHVVIFSNLLLVVISTFIVIVIADIYYNWWIPRKKLIAEIYKGDTND